MVAEYYEVPIIGDGITQDTGFRPDLSKVNGRVSVWMKTKSNGKPKHANCLILVEAEDTEHAKIVLSGKAKLKNKKSEIDALIADNV